MIRRCVVVFATIGLVGCVAYVPQPGTGGRSGGSFITGMTNNIPVIDEYQVAWVIPPITSQLTQVDVDQGDVVVSIPLQAERLFRATEQIASADGQPLIAAGEQLVLMDWNRFMACTIGSDDKLGRSSDDYVCLLDENGDAVPDTYFLRDSDGLNGMWFALNKRLPENRSSIGMVRLEEIDPKTLKRKPEFAVHFVAMLDGPQLVSMRASIEGKGYFSAHCPAYLGKESRGARVPMCLLPPVAIAPLSRSGESVRIAFRGFDQPAKVRFRVVYGALAGADVESIRIFFDADEDDVPDAQPSAPELVT